MPLPLGHAAIGFATYDIFKKETRHPHWWKQFILIIVLSNLPDLDVLWGLLVDGNGWVFHRGPTHSLAFALVGGLLASRSWRVWPCLPKMGFWAGFSVIFSHVLADILRGSESVASVFWPFQVAQVDGHIGWGETVGSIVFDAYQDWDLILASILIVFLVRWLRRHIARPAVSFKTLRAYQPE